MQNDITAFWLLNSPPKTDAMKLKIIECDELYPDLVDDYGSYGRMFEHYFKALSPTMEFQYFSAIRQQLPETFDQDDIFLITGSKFGVYEAEPWIQELLAWITKAYTAGSRFIGICFGHQALAQALGGQVEKSPKGWGLGVRTLEMDSDKQAQIDYGKAQFSLIYSHQDQVVQLPENAVTIVGDEFCPNAGFYIDHQVIAFQGHPEFTEVYARRLLTRRADRFEKDFFQSAMSSLSQPTDAASLGRAIIQYMHN